VESETRQEVAATLAARRELGADHDDALIAGFLERVENRLAAPRDTTPAEAVLRLRFILALVSLGAGIPISAIAASLTGLVGLAIVWAGIVGVNVAFRR
jgi:hypothetical protein